MRIGTVKGRRGMNISSTRFDGFIREEVDKYKGVYRQIKASLLRRLIIRNLACKSIHPNPDDEFCLPQVGPNYEIISHYEKEIRVRQKKERNPSFFSERVIVERIYPDGYMLLNGHHRWAAAIRMGVPKLRVRIVNLTQMSDIKEMIKNAKHDKRVTLDLDEVVFQTEPGGEVEKALPFPLNRRYNERLRRGIPALFHYLKKQGYDIWVYSSEYHSMDHIRRYFSFYHAYVDGVVTGMARKSLAGKEDRKRMEAMIASQYTQTIHIDRGSLVRVNRETKAFDEYALTGNPATWSQEIMEMIGALE